MLRYRLLTVLIASSFVINSYGQELFVYSEPASNMPAKSTGIRLSNWLMDEPATARINYHFIPEIMVGVNSRLMLHAEGFFSNRANNFSAEGAGIYAKYRFLSRDHVYRHFRMAAFVRGSTNNGDIHQEELTVNRHNTGYQLGLIGTQLLHKTALSGTVYYERVYDNFKSHDLVPGVADQAVSYSLSAGRLILPKKYTGYKQTNFNLMVEFIGQQLLTNSKMYLDVAPSLQFIFNSQTRVDIGYRHEIYSNMQRTAPNGILIRAEHLLFNITQKKTSK